jgi:hypothetical protein
LFRDLDLPRPAGQDPLIAAALRWVTGLGGSAITARRSTPDRPTVSWTTVPRGGYGCGVDERFRVECAPDFRAERAVDLALHRQLSDRCAWLRAVLGRTLCAAFGGDK